MDRSRREGGKQPPRVPAASRLNVRKGNRRKPVSLWSRMPRKRELIDACGRALRRSLPAIAVTAVILAVGASLWLGVRFVTTSERFAIASIEIRGAHQLDPDDVRTALPAQPGENIFTTDLDDLTSALRANPWIRTASAHRILPDKIVVEIHERGAIAIVQLGGELYLVDDTGQPFKRAQLDTGETADLPIVTGIRKGDVRPELVLRALDALDRWRANAERPDISEVHIDAHHAITLYTYDRGVSIQLGAMRDLDARLATFDAAWADLTDSERARVTAMHLDARSDHVTVAFKD